MQRKEKYLQWRIVQPETGSSMLPCSIVTAGLPKSLSPLPLEVSLLLPARTPTSALPSHSILNDTSAAGVFVGNPFLNRTVLRQNLRRRGVSWLCNLPSVCQYEDLFLRHLNDVGLGYETELRALMDLCGDTIAPLVVVGRPQEADVAVSMGARALLVVPSADRYESGFPSPRVRSEQLDTVRKAVPGFDGPVLGLITDAEKAFPSAWPKGMDAAVIRPSM